MAESRETSILFSLKGLLDLEDERVRAEEQRRRDEEEREAAAREAAARAAREAEHARIVAVERAAALQRLAAEQERQQGEAARLAALERARIEAEAAARVAVLERQQAHELRLHEIAAVGSGRRARLVLLGSNLAWAALLASAAVGYLTVLRPAAARQRAALAGIVQVQTERAETSARLMREADALASSLRARIADLERERVTAPPVAPTATRSTGRQPPNTNGDAPASPARAGCRSESGDPLDFSLCGE